MKAHFSEGKSRPSFLVEYLAELSQGEFKPELRCVLYTKYGHTYSGVPIQYFSKNDPENDTVTIILSDVHGAGSERVAYLLAKNITGIELLEGGRLARASQAPWMMDPTCSGLTKLNSQRTCLDLLKNSFKKDISFEFKGFEEIEEAPGLVLFFVKLLAKQVDELMLDAMGKEALSEINSITIQFNDQAGIKKDQSHLNISISNDSKYFKTSWILENLQAAL